eukprot:PhM_4_TR9101/c0_g1_i1/m.80648
MSSPIQFSSSSPPCFTYFAAQGKGEVKEGGDGSFVESVLTQIMGSTAAARAPNIDATTKKESYVYYDTPELYLYRKGGDITSAASTSTPTSYRLTCNGGADVVADGIRNPSVISQVLQSTSPAAMRLPPALAKKTTWCPRVLAVVTTTTAEGTLPDTTTSKVVVRVTHNLEAHTLSMSTPAELHHTVPPWNPRAPPALHIGATTHGRLVEVWLDGATSDTVSAIAARLRGALPALEGPYRRFSLYHLTCAALYGHVLDDDELPLFLSDGSALSDAVTAHRAISGGGGGDASPKAAVPPVVPRAAQEDILQPLLARSRSASASSGSAPPRRAQAAAMPRLPRPDAPKVTVRPKTLFSNERTFLHWQHQMVLLIIIGFGLLSASQSDRRIDNEALQGNYRRCGIAAVAIGGVWLVVSLAVYFWRMRVTLLGRQEGHTDVVSPLVQGLAVLGVLVAVVAGAAIANRGHMENSPLFAPMSYSPSAATTAHGKRLAATTDGILEPIVGCRFATDDPAVPVTLTPRTWRRSRDNVITASSGLEFVQLLDADGSMALARFGQPSDDAGDLVVLRLGPGAGSRVSVVARIPPSLATSRDVVSAAAVSRGEGLLVLRGDGRLDVMSLVNVSTHHTCASLSTQFVGVVPRTLRGMSAGRDGRVHGFAVVGERDVVMCPDVLAAGGCRAEHLALPPQTGSMKPVEPSSLLDVHFVASPGRYLVSDALSCTEVFSG